MRTTGSPEPQSSATSSSVQEARQALGRRLREIRKNAGLTARELARRADWHESKCSRLESGRTPPPDAEFALIQHYAPTRSTPLT
ncbi:MULTISPECIES: helix-turn-helix transcriptional regulator [Streptomyces]|uniref:Regulatory protein n=1 Tax=Streptomyces bottropensis ATCC 25435 TaxID=1054862 RepID=M3EUG7_9ACTN|nr:MULTISPECIES: helix-turn-helix transcriptional regulator [Streptomyces]EMF52768.1 regulatory protein [Streptomyces bottropensis ATCC 25435]